MKYTIYKDDNGHLRAFDGHIEFEGVIAKVIDNENCEIEQENKKLRARIKELEKLIEGYKIQAKANYSYLSEADKRYRDLMNWVSNQRAMIESKSFMMCIRCAEVLAKDTQIAREALGVKDE